MKKLIAVLTALALAALPLLAFGEGSAEDFGGATLNVYNWGEYIDKEVLRSFEKQYNCKVNYKTFESNEALYTNIIGGDDPWDILVPSDYMIERLIREKRLQPLDRDIVNNLDNLTDKVKNLPFDCTTPRRWTKPRWRKRAGIFSLIPGCRAMCTCMIPPGTDSWSPSKLSASPRTRTTKKRSSRPMTGCCR